VGGAVGSGVRAVSLQTGVSSQAASQAASAALFYTVGPVASSMSAVPAAVAGCVAVGAVGLGVVGTAAVG
jgi:hypothetical protein